MGKTHIKGFIKVVNSILCSFLIVNSIFTVNFVAEEIDNNEDNNVSQVENIETEEISVINNEDPNDILEEEIVNPQDDAGLEEEMINPQDDTGLEEETVDTQEALDNNENLDSEDTFNLPPLTYKKSTIYDGKNLIHQNKKKFLFANEIPSQYDSRNVGGVNYVSPVKDQNPFGTCWAFATMAAVESSYMRSHGGEVIDLSEFHLAWFVYNNYQYADPLNLMTNDGYYEAYHSNNDRIVGTTLFNQGGSENLSMDMFAQGIGLCTESAFPYSSSNTISSSDCYKRDYILTNVNVLNMSKTNTDAIKKEIMSKGAVTVSMAYDGNAVSGEVGASFNYDNSSYYRGSNGVQCNHGVTIVGWDDTYSKTNFNVQPANNGAWLVKNSWGTDWGDNGYFWISYDEGSLYGTSSSQGTAYSFDIMEDDSTNPYKIYGYDGGTSEMYGSVGPEYEMLGGCVFTAEEDEIIEKVGIKTYESDITYTIFIYKNVTSLDDPRSGTLVGTYTGTVDYAGYHTIDIPGSVTIEEGTNYSVIYGNGKGKDIGFTVQFEEDGYNGSDGIVDEYSFESDANSHSHILYRANTTSTNLGYYTTATDFSGCPSADIKLKVLTKKAPEEQETTASYKVEHYQENLTGGYTLKDTENLTGSTGATVNGTSKTYEGFEYDSSITGTVASGTVLANGSLVLKLYYKRKSFTITFNTDGGSTIPQATYKYGQTVTAPSAPTKTGYTFNGWNPALPSTMPASNLTVTATWSANTYIISYDLAGGNHGASHPTSATYGNEFTINNPTKFGYEFAGWTISGLDNTSHIIGGSSSSNTSATGVKGTSFKNLTSVNSATVSFTATWAASNNVHYYVKHYVQDTNGNYSSEPIHTQELTGQMDSMVTASPLDSLVLTGYTFDSTNANNVNSATLNTDGIVLKQYYKRNKYHVTLNSGQGISNVTGEGDYYYEKEVSISATCNEGYTFVNWTKDSQNVSTSATYQITIGIGDASYTANCNANVYNINYVLDGGTAGYLAPHNATFDQEFTVTNPTKLGYTFTGWYITGMGGTTTHYLGSTTSSSNSYDSGTPIKGDTDTTFKNLNSAASSTVILTANWQANNDTPYKVEHYLANANGTYPNTPFQTDDLTGSTGSSIEATPLTKVGYTYDTNSIKTGTILANGSLVIKLYYKRNIYTIIYDGNGASSGSISDSTVAFDTDLVLPNNTFIKDEYVFAGWQVSNDTNYIKCPLDKYKVDEAFINAYSITDNITVKAIWESTAVSVSAQGTFTPDEVKDTTDYADNAFGAKISNDNLSSLLFNDGEVHTAIGWLSANEISFNSPKDNQILSAIASKNVIVNYHVTIDINLYYSEDGSTVNKAVNTFAPVKITTNLSSNDNLKNAALANKLVVYSMHNGELQNPIFGSYDSATGDFTFSTSKFSIYALCAVESLPSQNSSNSSSGFHIPNTGIYYPNN